ncbi:MAG: ABC transporter substrate-binding protein [Acidimicrobiia bacterium]|nr:ABC transporter substrate-binding protein [Acidimicrobiia bacterium]
MSKGLTRLLALMMALALAAAACGGSDDNKSDSGGKGKGVTTEKLDYKAIGLWDDGPCSPSEPPLKIGLMTVFESPVVSLKDQATALEVAAKAFNKRGGANGSCVQVTTCDDGANTDQAVACVRKIDNAGVVATVNDQGTAGAAEVSAAMQKAKIPRVASNVGQDDWGDPNAYPLDASGTGVTFLLPQGLINEGSKKIGLIRVDLAQASALKGLLADAYKGKADMVYDTPVPGGTTDFTQFILGAQNAGADGAELALGENEALQVVKAGQQLNTKMLIGSSLGTFSHKSVEDLGDFSKQMVFMWSYPPATIDLPVYKALRQDLASTGEEQLQPENLKASPMRSWIGLYALLKMIRDAKMKTFTREGISKMLNEAKDVPMLNIFGGENWTPNTDHPGLYKRAGTNHWGIYRWDPNAKAPDGLTGGNFVEKSTISFDKVLCGTIFGAPKDQC